MGMFIYEICRQKERGAKQNDRALQNAIDYVFNYVCYLYFSL